MRGRLRTRSFPKQIQEYSSNILSSLLLKLTNWKPRNEIKDNGKLNTVAHPSLGTTKESIEKKWHINSVWLDIRRQPFLRTIYGFNSSIRRPHRLYSSREKFKHTLIIYSMFGLSACFLIAYFHDFLRYWRLDLYAGNN